MFEAFNGRKVLVTGGTGFIGARLAARLSTECGADVRVLARSFTSAPRVARFPVELVGGDVTRPDDVMRAAERCDYIFHCAYGKDGPDSERHSGTVAGTRNVMEAARRYGARVVHVSTVSVYGDLADGTLHETAPRQRTGDTYGDSKLDAEQAALEYGREHDVPVSVVQPTVVYGPFGSTWSMNPLKQLRAGRVILVNGGTGLCNAVYVDDVVTAMLLVAVKDAAVGETFLVSGPAPVTWREFYGYYESMLGVSATVTMSVAEAEAHFRASGGSGSSLIGKGLEALRRPELRGRLLATREGAFVAKTAKAIMPAGLRDAIKRRMSAQPAAAGTAPLRAAVESRQISPLRPAKIRFMAARTAVSIDKAARLLGYEPAFDVATGMRLTEQWARWANLLGEEQREAA
jgi:nucleoside-diphosphate-sugar epimerase